MMKSLSTHLDVDPLFMERAIVLAQKAALEGEVPVGAVVVLDGEIIGEGYNQTISACDPSAHAEIIALRRAATNIANHRLVDSDLYVTLEPCAMCAGAMIHARVNRLIFGTEEPKAGVLTSQQNFFEQPWLNHRVQCFGPLLQERCAEMLTSFFKARRREKK